VHGTPLHRGFEHPASLLHYLMEVKRKKKKAINKVIHRVYSGCRGGEEEASHYTFRDTSSHLPKAASCHSVGSNNHTALCVSSGPETSALTTLQQWTGEVQVVLRPFGASCRQQPALACSKPTRWTLAHASLASGEVTGTALTKFITVSVSAVVSSAGLRFSCRKEIVNSLAFALDKHFRLHFATARNS